MSKMLLLYKLILLIEWIERIHSVRWYPSRLQVLTFAKFLLQLQSAVSLRHVRQRANGVFLVAVGPKGGASLFECIPHSNHLLVCLEKLTSFERGKLINRRFGFIPSGSVDRLFMGVDKAL